MMSALVEADVPPCDVGFSWSESFEEGRTATGASKSRETASTEERAQDSCLTSMVWCHWDEKKPGKHRKVNKGTVYLVVADKAAPLHLCNGLLALIPPVVDVWSDLRGGERNSISIQHYLDLISIQGVKTCTADLHQSNLLVIFYDCIQLYFYVASIQLLHMSMMSSITTSCKFGMILWVRAPFSFRQFSMTPHHQ